MELSTQPPPDFGHFLTPRFFKKSWSQDLSFADLLILSFGVTFTFGRLQVFKILAQKYLTTDHTHLSDKKSESEKAAWKANLQSFLDYLSHSCNVRPP